jgi:hypothetical protein
VCGLPWMYSLNVCPLGGPSSNTLSIGALESTPKPVCLRILRFAGPCQTTSPVARDRSSSHSDSGNGGRRLPTCLAYHSCVMLRTRHCGIALPQLFSAGISTLGCTLAESRSKKALCFAWLRINASTRGGGFQDSVYGFGAENAATSSCVWGASGAMSVCVSSRLLFPVRPYVNINTFSSGFRYPSFARRSIDSHLRPRWRSLTWRLRPIGLLHAATLGR